MELVYAEERMLDKKKERALIASLNITLNTNAPEACCWWKVTFGNRKFGEDWSRGWSEHTQRAHPTTNPTLTDPR